MHYACSLPLNHAEPREKRDVTPPEAAIRVEHATQAFRVIRERPDTLRELFANFLRHKASYHSFEAVRDVSFVVATRANHRNTGTKRVGEKHLAEDHRGRL